MATRLDLDGNAIQRMTICIIGAHGFIGSYLCEKILSETPHSILAVDVYDDKIGPLSSGSHPSGRIEFHWIDSLQHSWLLIQESDLTINLAAIRTPGDYKHTIYSNFIDALPVVKYCTDNGKRIIHFSTCEVYGKTIGSFLPKDSSLREDPAYYVLKEDESPCIFGPIEKQKWSYACAKQLLERLIYAEGAKSGLKFTIVRPFNWIGPGMDFTPGINCPGEGVPRVLDCFSNNLSRREPLKLVDGNQSQRTFVYIDDAIDAILLMIENPARANGHIFNVGNPNNEDTMRQLADIITEAYSKVSGELSVETPTVDVSSKEFYGEGYDDTDKRIPDMTLVNKQLGWNPKTSLWSLLESTMTYQLWITSSCKEITTVARLDSIWDKVQLCYKTIISEQEGQITAQDEWRIVLEELVISDIRNCIKRMYPSSPESVSPTNSSDFENYILDFAMDTKEKRNSGVVGDLSLASASQLIDDDEELEWSDWISAA